MSVECSILIDGNDPDPKLGIVQARIKEGMNQITRIELILASGKSDLDPEKYLGHKATVKFGDPQHTPEFENRYDGLVFRFGRVQKSWSGDSLSSYQVDIRPQVWKLNLHYGSSIMRNLALPKAVSQVLNNGGLVEKTDYQFQLINQSAYPQEEQIVQYRETDLDFVTRSLAGSGINYYFTYSGSDNPEKLTMSDDRSYFKNPYQKDIPFELSRGMISDKPRVNLFESSGGYLPKQVKVETHQKLNPHQKFSSQRDIQEGKGPEVSLFGDAGLNQEEAVRMAKVGAQELASRQVLGRGRSNVARFRSGEIFPLAFKSGDSQKFLLTEVEHLATQNPQYALARNNSSFEYENSFRVVKSDADYRPGNITPLLAGLGD